MNREAVFIFPKGFHKYPVEGSVANVHYIFADGSAIDIPMVFAEESSQIWLLSLGDIDSIGRHSTGPLDGENQARVVYAEYGPGMKIGLPWQNCRKNGCM